MGKVRDLMGQRFGRLVFLERLHVDSRRRSVWRVRCDCGNLADVVGTRVTSGHKTSCGCLAVNTPSDIAGERFGRLVALGTAGKSGSRSVLWGCLCDCGTKVQVPANKLKSGHTRSCGCLQVEKVSSLNRTHGKSGTSTYSTWLAMWARCTNPNNSSYKNYGGRGIKVCSRWTSFTSFLKDMGEKPLGLSIERVNNDKGYSPSNCIWADRATQNRNTRRQKRN